MSQRQRQPAANPVAMSWPTAFRSSIPRFQDMPQDFDTSYYPVSQPEMQNYTMMSSCIRPPFQQGLYMTADYDFFPDSDETTSAPMSACGSTTVADISPPQSDDGIDSTYPLPYTTAEICNGSVLSPDMTFGPVYETLPMDWPFQGPPSPPPEQSLSRQLETMEPSVCEHLGVSKLQAYSKPRRSSPRPLRPSNERQDSQDSNEDATSQKSKDDPERTKFRTDALYDTKPDKDGYYHCPKKHESGCKHDPTKQKCIFAKYLDSHLRPYICKYASEQDSECQDLRFSSNACLFRHQREAHGMHGYGNNPYSCKFPDCERSKPGNGFPRRWNQRDHMKRVHGYHVSEDSSSTRSKGGRKSQQKPGSAAMRRSDSGKSLPYRMDDRPDVNARHAQLMYGQVDYTMPVPLDSFQYIPSPHTVYYQGY